MTLVLVPEFVLPPCGMVPPSLFTLKLVKKCMLIKPPPKTGPKIDIHRQRVAGNSVLVPIFSNFSRCVHMVMDVQRTTWCVFNDNEMQWCVFNDKFFMFYVYLSIFSFIHNSLGLLPTKVFHFQHYGNQSSGDGFFIVTDCLLARTPSHIECQHHFLYAYALLFPHTTSINKIACFFIYNEENNYV